jgi:hypothetical protein
MRPLTSIPLAAALLFTSATITRARTQKTLLFDGTGPEVGITVPGAKTFTALGSDWSGGIVQTMFSPPLYASGVRSYEVVLGTDAEVRFHDSIGAVDFFFVHNGLGVPTGTATFFDASGAVLGSAASQQATVFGDPANFVSFTHAGITRVVFTGGVVDNFSYTTEDDCAPGASLCADRHVLSLAQGGQQVLALDAGPSHAGALFILVGSLSGTSPGLVLDGLVLPINPDAYTNLTLTPTPLLAGTPGFLDASGKGSVQFNLPPATSPGFAGLTLQHAFAGFDLTAGKVTFTSNAETLTLMP